MRCQVVFVGATIINEFQIFFIVKGREGLSKIHLRGMREPPHVVVVSMAEIYGIYEQPQLLILWYTSVERDRNNSLFYFTPAEQAGFKLVEEQELHDALIDSCVASTTCLAVYPKVAIKSRMIDGQQPFATDRAELGRVKR